MSLRAFIFNVVFYVNLILMLTFLMPFLFVYTPLLLESGPWVNALTIATATTAAVTFAATVQRYFLRRTTRPEQLALAAGTVALFTTRPVVNGVGLALVLAVLARQRFSPGPS